MDTSVMLAWVKRYAASTRVDRAPRIAYPNAPFRGAAAVVCLRGFR